MDCVSATVGLICKTEEKKRKVVKPLICCSWLWFVRDSSQTDLNSSGLWVVKVGSSGVDVSKVGRGIRGGPPAVLLQDFLVRFGVKVRPPHQHLVFQGTRITSQTHLL